MHLIIHFISLALPPPASLAPPVCRCVVDSLTPFRPFKVEYFSLLQRADCMNEGWNCQSFPPNYCVICDYVYQHIDLLQDPRVEDNAALNICDVVPLLNDNDIRIWFSFHYVAYRFIGK